ncbi:MAG: phosphoenolpyruvate kinase, partial [Thermoanaerobaculia bacterium]|nr:phosphoenolpyruvate kinase [Thermoanaerobaculia bacterium]
MPIHTVYIGAHAFDRTTIERLTDDCRSFFRSTLSDPQRLVSCCGLDGTLAEEVSRRTAEQLASSPIEDLRVDFEDGYAGRDEDADGGRVARVAAEMYLQGELPPGFGLRIRSMAHATAERSRATLDLFLGTLLDASGGWPQAPVVTLAKIDVPAEVARLADALDELEDRHGLEPGSVPIELMAETPQSIYDCEGRLAVPSLVAAARGRCASIHFGIYDYTASLGLVADQQRLRHPACDTARAVLQIGLAGLADEVELSDGSPRIVPRLAMDDADLDEAIRGVYGDVRHALDRGIYRGWDMAGSHVAIRRVAVTA